MSNYQNHVIDPTFFFDAIEEFSFDYDIYVVIDKKLDSGGREKITFDKTTIRGSLQSNGTTLSQSFEGNETRMSYNFYCKSLYRINIGDVIFYKGHYLRCDSVQDFDEFGVRACTLQKIQLASYRDLFDYIKYLEGEKII